MQGSAPPMQAYMSIPGVGNAPLLPIHHFFNIETFFGGPSPRLDDWRYFYSRIQGCIWDMINICSFCIIYRCTHLFSYQRNAYFTVALLYLPTAAYPLNTPYISHFKTHIFSPHVSNSYQSFVHRVALNTCWRHVSALYAQSPTHHQQWVVVRIDEMRHWPKTLEPRLHHGLKSPDRASTAMPPPSPPGKRFNARNTPNKWEYISPN